MPISLAGYDHNNSPYCYIRDEYISHYLTAIKDRADSTLGIHLLNYFTDHSIKHSNRLITIVNQLIEDMEASSKLTDRELFTLYAACYLHDIGMNHDLSYITRTIQDELSKSLVIDEFADDPYKKAWVSLGTKTQHELLRKHHHQISADMISPSDGYLQVVQFSLPDEVGIECIANICESHGLNLDDDEESRRYTLITKTVCNMRIGLLAALLRIADILDETESRIVPFHMDITALDIVSQIHWYRHIYTKDVLFDHDKRQISIEYNFNADNAGKYKDVIPELQIPWIRKELARHYAQLSAFNIAWTVQSDCTPKARTNTRPIPDEVFDEMRRQLVLRSIDENHRAYFKEQIPEPSRIKLHDFPDSRNALNTNISVIYGLPGSGKSCLAATLFQPIHNKGYMTVWFNGHSADALRDLLLYITQNSRCLWGLKLRIIVDESHEAGRDLTFFQDSLNIDLRLFTNIWFLLAIRTDTYDILNLNRQINGANAFCLDNNKQAVYNSLRLGMWNSHGRLITEDDINHIDILAGCSDNINLLMLDRYLSMCRPPSKREVQIYSKGTESERLYHFFIDNMFSEDEKEILWALYTAKKITDHIPLWLMLVIIHSKDDEATIAIGNIQNSLRILVMSQILVVNDSKVSLDLGFSMYHFNHDLFRDALSHRQTPDTHDYNVDFSHLEKYSLILIDKHAHMSVDDLANGFHLWCVLAISSMNICLSLMVALTKASMKLGSSGDDITNKGVVQTVSSAALWVIRSLVVSTDAQRDSLISAYENMLRAIKACIYQGALEDTCTVNNHIFALMSALISLTPRMNTSASIQEVYGIINTELTETCILLTERPINEDILVPFSVAIHTRYICLLGHAQKMDEAANLVVDTIDTVFRGDVYVDKLAMIGRTIYAAALFVSTEQYSRAVRVYNESMELIPNDDFMCAIIPLFESDRNFIISCSSCSGKDRWRALDEHRVKKLEDSLVKNQYLRDTVYVVTEINDLGIASHIHGTLTNLGIHVEIVLWYMVSSLHQFDGQRGVILLEHRGLLKEYINDSDIWSNITEPTNSITPYLQYDFDIKGCPSIWLGHYYSSKNILRVKYWIEHEIMDFVTRISS